LVGTYSWFGKKGASEAHPALALVTCVLASNTAVVSVAKIASHVLERLFWDF
jgi:hypothetical protein